MRTVPPAFVDATAQYGLARMTPTFSAAFADLDNDGRDDLVVSNHGRDVALYLNRGDRFDNRSDLLPRTNNDRHGLTVYDLDGDGDRDIALATGGGGVNFSISQGNASQIFANRLAVLTLWDGHGVGDSGGSAWSPMCMGGEVCWRTNVPGGLPIAARRDIAYKGKCSDRFAFVVELSGLTGLGTRTAEKAMECVCASFS